MGSPLPLLGRFIQEDSFAGMDTLPQSLNRYAYVHNNPTRFTDPSGHFAPIVVLGGIASAAFGGFLFGAGLSIARQAVASATTDHQFSGWEVFESGLHGAAWGAGFGALAVALPLVGVSAATVTVGASIGFGFVSLVSAAIEAERGNKALAVFDVATIFLPAFSSKARGDFGEFYGGGYTGSGLPKVIVEGYRSFQPGVAEVTQHLYSSQDRLTHLEAALRQNRSNQGQGGGFDGMSPGAELVTPEGITLPVPEKSAAQALNSFAVQGGNRWAGRVLEEIVYENETFTIESNSFEIPKVKEWTSVDGLGALERHLVIKGWEALLESQRRGPKFWETFRRSRKDEPGDLRGIAADALLFDQIPQINKDLEAAKSPYIVKREPSATPEGDRVRTKLDSRGNPIPNKDVLRPDVAIYDTRIVDINTAGEKAYRVVSVIDISFGSLVEGSKGYKDIITKYRPAFPHANIYDVRIRTSNYYNPRTRTRESGFEKIYIPVRRK